MKTVEFDTFKDYDDDNSWEVLLVRVDGGNWVVASEVYKTEDVDLISKIINPPKHKHEFINVLFGDVLWV